MKAGAELKVDACSGGACSGRLCVMHVQVEAMQVWFRCPYCDTALAGYLSDPRGQRDITCSDCGEVFDVPAQAAVVII